MEEKKIYKAIAGIMAEIGHIGKDRRNVQQGFAFRGIDQVMNTMKPLFAKYGVFIVPEVIDMKREERTTRSGSNLIFSVLTVRHHFYAEDGSEVVSTTIGEGMDSADKASNKAMAIAFKYACFQVFCIPTEEMAKDDPDAYCQDASENAAVVQVRAHLKAAATIDDLVMLWNSCDATMQQRLAAEFTDAKTQITECNNGTTQH